MINFVNGLAVLKDANKPVDEAGLRNTRVFAKLMLSKGTKFDDVVCRDQFLLSENGTYIKGELFYLNKSNSMVIDSRLFVNVELTANIKVNKVGRFYYVELIHPTVDLTNDELVSF